MAIDDPGPECRFETVVAAGAEAARFNRALFQYLECFAPADGACATVHSSPEGQGERKAIALWSAEAARDFALFWAQLNRSGGRRGAGEGHGLVA
jgi:hypothetical protein